MWSGASHGLRRTLAYLGGRLVRQNAIRTPPKCSPTYLRSRVGRGSWEKWAFHDEAMTMFEEGLSQLVGSHSGEGNWCRALDAHRMQLKQGLGLRSRWGPTRIIYLNILSRTTSTRFLGTTQHPLWKLSSIAQLTLDWTFSIGSNYWGGNCCEGLRGPRDSLAPRLFVP